MNNISIVIPIYNEHQRIYDCVSKLTNYCKKNIKNWEIIIVDDGSHCKYDIKNSKNIRLVGYEVNMGKGFATAWGVMEAKKDYILTTDCDLSTPINELEKFFKYRKEYDIIIANRNDKKSQVDRKGYFRGVLGGIFPLIVKLIFRMNIDDTQCGFKLYKRKTAQYLFRRLKTYRWAFDVEILYRATKKGYFIKELPVLWVHDERSKVDVIRDSWRMFKDLINIKRMDI